MPDKNLFKITSPDNIRAETKKSAPKGAFFITEYAVELSVGSP